MRFNKIAPILLCLMLLSCQETIEQDASFTQKQNVELAEIDEGKLELKANQGLVYFDGSPFTGVAVTCYESGAKAKTIPYVQGIKHGLYQKWFDCGRLSYQANYIQGKQHGTTQSWWKNGNLRSESNFEKGIAHGKQLQWYQNGASFKSLNLVHGKEEGLQQSWRENGKIYNNYEAKNGRIFGLKRANLCFALDDEVVQNK